ncbi:MAG TPA: hypothetical protein VLG28_09405 [Acidimicrobiia bacterium]|jgi:hypothetical protein|nr:hypothetical protein [Acidimicrobiia bacterium]
MSAAELPEPGVAEPNLGAEGDESTRPRQQEAEIERLQLRLNELRTRIQAALPEGFDLDELRRAGGDRHESEEVFEITSEIEVLENLAGPLMVPGATPQPAFDAMPPFRTMADDLEPLPSERRASRWKWVIIALVVLIAVIAAIALVAPGL